MTHSDRASGIKVCLIEENPLAAHYILGLLCRDPQVCVVGLDDLWRDTSGEPSPVVFLIDDHRLTFPTSEYLRRLRTLFSEPRFLVMNHGEAKEEITRLLWQGIDGFVPYQEVAESLLSAIHTVAGGQMWVPRDILKEYVQRTKEVNRGSRNGFENLTSRENQIIELVKRRLSNKEIANILRIRESTVKFHLSNIFGKLQVTNRRDLLSKDTEAMDWGLVFPDCAFSRSGS